MIRRGRILFKMANAEILKRLETRSVAAEQMIQALRLQIDGIRLTTKKSSSITEHNELRTLTMENEQLKKEILAQKSRLIAAETEVGIRQITNGNSGKSANFGPFAFFWT